MLDAPLKKVRLLRLYGLSDGIGDKYLTFSKIYLYGQNVNINATPSPSDLIVDTSTITSESDLTAIGITITGSGDPFPTTDSRQPWGFLSDSGSYWATAKFWAPLGTEGWVQIKFDTPILLSWMQLLDSAITDIKFEYSTTDNGLILYQYRCIRELHIVVKSKSSRNNYVRKSFEEYSIVASLRFV